MIGLGKGRFGEVCEVGGGGRCVTECAREIWVHCTTHLSGREPLVSGVGGVAVEFVGVGVGGDYSITLCRKGWSFSQEPPCHTYVRSDEFVQCLYATSKP